MASIWFRTVFALLIALAIRSAEAASEIAVANRYLLANGASHSQIFLYREDGTLLRQLTNDDSGQMKNPVFASDGASIVFTRELPGGAHDYWSVEPKDKNLRKLDAAPPWYISAVNAPYFTNEPASDSQAPTPSAAPASPLIGPGGPDDFTSPDGTQQLLLKLAGEGDEEDQPGRGAHYELRDLKTGKSVELGSLPGFLGLWGLLHLNGDAGSVFLISPPLRVAFFDLHLDSTAGDTVFALDLANPRLVRLSPNWASPVPLPGEPAFLTATEQRYVPIPGSRKTANCSYIEHWSAALENIRYARSPAVITYGASMYRPSKTPATVTIHSEEIIETKPSRVDPKIGW